MSCVLSFVPFPVHADVCAWRDPERTMQRIFPDAQDYKTLTFTMTAKNIAAIESLLGAPLEESEKVEFNLYNITGGAGSKSGLIGTVVALAGKGEYGTIEVTIGIDTSGKIAGAYIQRSRERATASLQSDVFLRQFIGKSWRDDLTVGKTINTAAPEAQSASVVVAIAIRKMLVFHHVLTTGAKP